MRIFSFLLFMILFGCTEPYHLQTSSFEEALVIEATLSNELKTQQIKISKTYRLEENGPNFIENANVSIEDDLGNVYPFIEGNEIYESQNQFQAIAGRKYKLTIITEGKTYTSTQETLTTDSPIQSIDINDIQYSGERGAEIKINAFDPTNSSKYYRYEFEETYKIIAPQWLPFTTKVDPTPPNYPLINTPRTYEAQTCYSTKKSDEILLHSTSNLTEDRVNFMVRFIPVTDPIIAHRYSILVKQYVHSLESYTYYNTLKNITGSGGSILSQNQPGFFSGNITCESNPNEKVIGFFDVSSVSTQRIFFNFEDVFPTAPRPTYFYECLNTFCSESDPRNCPGAQWYCFDPTNPLCDGFLVMAILNSNAPTRAFFEYVHPAIFLTPIQCADCTTFSSNLVPTFWQ